MILSVLSSRYTRYLDQFKQYRLGETTPVHNLQANRYSLAVFAFLWIQFAGHRASIQTTTSMSMYNIPALGTMNIIPRHANPHGTSVRCVNGLVPRCCLSKLHLVSMQFWSAGLSIAVRSLKRNNLTFCSSRHQTSPMIQHYLRLMADKRQQSAELIPSSECSDFDNAGTGLVKSRSLPPVSRSGLPCAPASTI